MVKRIIRIVRHFTEDQSDILGVYLLGSVLKGTQREDSDIDLGLMLEPGVRMQLVDRIHLANELTFELGRTVDLGEISTRNLVYSREALLNGKLIYQKDPDRINLVRANLLGMYIQFNLDRREIIDAYNAG